MVPVAKIACTLLSLFIATAFASEIGVTANDVVSIWPAAGVSLWAVWRFQWLGVLLSFIVFHGYGHFFLEIDNLIPSIGNAVAAGLGGTYMLKRFRHGHSARMQNLTHIFVGGVILSVFAGVVGSWHISTSMQELTWVETVVLGARWALSDMAGVVLTTPALVTLSTSASAPNRADFFGWITWVGGCVLLLLFFVLQQDFEQLSVSSITLLILGPYVFWAVAYERSLPMVTMVSLVGLLAFTMVARTLNHDSPALLEGQLFILGLFLAGYYISELLSQQKVANEKLEERVAERTRELSDAKLAAEAADRSKSQFLANTSHEVRTPLNGIIGMADLLRQTELSEDQASKVDTIFHSGHGLLNIMNDIIDLSKVEAGKLEIARSATDIRRLIASMSSLWGAIAKDKQIELTFTTRDLGDGFYALDPLRIRQCLSNLISNALKFTREGHISVDVCAHVRNDVSGLHFVVSDTGIGMSEQTVDKLFQPFEQGGADIAQRFGGAGLGLAITHNLIALMDGSISVASELGQGTQFEFFVPASEVSPDALSLAETHCVAEEDIDRLRGLRVLLVEDNPVNRIVAHGLLKDLEFEIHDAENGAECLRALAEAAYDLVLLDIHMPVMDGTEAIGHIRSSAEPWCSIPVIALTADAMSEDRDRLLQLGIDGYASKPIDRQALLSEMVQVLAPSGPPSMLKPPVQPGHLST